MEEDLKNMSKEELLEYLEEISQQLDNIALDQIEIAIAELQYFKDQYKQLEEENKVWKNNYYEQKEFNNKQALYIADNFISTSLVKETIEELKEKEQELSDEQGYWGGSDLLAKIEVLQDLLERSREDEI